MQQKGSELILNADRSIYHLHLHPENIADTIITVGDPGRVAVVSNHFDRVDFRKSNREFVTHTGYLNKRRLTVISTGIGTDNVDIVLNELDALANIDLETGNVSPMPKQLSFIRIGTSGAIQPEISLDSFVLSEYAVGLDGLLHFYRAATVDDLALQAAFRNQLTWAPAKALPYFEQADPNLAGLFLSDQMIAGLTVTNAGFYGPQGRTLRVNTTEQRFAHKLAALEFRGRKVTNMEMETSAIYGLSHLLGHRAVSLNCILANRATGNFSRKPEKTVDRMVAYALDKLSST